MSTWRHRIQRSIDNVKRITGPGEVEDRMEGVVATRERTDTNQSANLILRIEELKEEKQQMHRDLEQARVNLTIVQWWFRYIETTIPEQAWSHIQQMVMATKGKSYEEMMTYWQQAIMMQRERISEG